MRFCSDTAFSKHIMELSISGREGFKAQRELIDEAVSELTELIDEAVSELTAYNY